MAPPQRLGLYRPSKVDSLLSHAEETAGLLLQPPQALATPAQWLDALGLPADSPVRANERFGRFLVEVSGGAYDDARKRGVLRELRRALSLDARFEGEQQKVA